MILNCGQCEHLKSETTMLLAFYYCGHAKALKRMVPQSSHNDPSTGAKSATFPRVPEWCPLPASKALKSPPPSEDTSA